MKNYMVVAKERPLIASKYHAQQLNESTVEDYLSLSGLVE